MDKELKCPKCGQEMEEGYVPDSMWKMASEKELWIQGLPDWHSKFLNGMPKDRKVAKVTTFRCVCCGYLEAYAKL